MTMIRSAVFFAAALACGVVAEAQQRDPEVGGTTQQVPDDGSKEMRSARRAIMRDTVGRQYTAEEIEEYRRTIDAYDRSKSGVYAEAAKVVRRRISVDLGADAPVQEIRLNAEMTASLVFTDSFGHPWNVDDVLAPNFLVPKKTGNIITLSPAGGTGQGAMRFGRSSITVLLEGMTSTVPFSLSYGLSKEVDVQIEAQIQARNPKAAVSAVQGGNIESDEMFGLFLDGEPPREALKLKTSLKTVDAWAYMGRLYVRTALALHSPAFRMYGSSASGINVYRFDRAPSIINAIADGAIVAVAIGD